MGGYVSSQYDLQTKAESNEIVKHFCKKKNSQADIVRT
jgi:hypothetical protein